MTSSRPGAISLPLWLHRTLGSCGRSRGAGAGCGVSAKLQGVWADARGLKDADDAEAHMRILTYEGARVVPLDGGFRANLAMSDNGYDAWIRFSSSAEAIVSAGGGDIKPRSSGAEALETRASKTQVIVGGIYGE
ncbi:hypothetical protein NDU88_000201 [Pleurodeles waltl]|uniref:Uncharacterized protein n=1 Tax=Pleurodeles waltl TaxID=8319 RepID=A0AAV7L5Q8_PLEWA|nr:hypothetical protein NDU88_000201 [Pleurodeles waltl]